MQRAIAAIVIRQDRFLVIRRAAGVAAPRKLCFPGGHVEAGETEPDAVQRELLEELGVIARPLRRVWESTTAWGVRLAWWLTELEHHDSPRPNPAEVEAVFWHTPAELARSPLLLENNRAFLQALAARAIELQIAWE
jgi:mutator protein MutT